MRGLGKLLIAITIFVVAILFWAVVFWLVSDPDFTFKNCIQFPPVWLLGIILGIIGIVAYFYGFDD